jgi:hypothetical protein
MVLLLMEQMLLLAQITSRQKWQLQLLVQLLQQMACTQTDARVLLAQASHLLTAM